MAHPKGPELGVRSPLSLRVGHEIAKFRGTNTHGDPGSISPDQFQALENVSFDGIKWGSRDGVSKVNSAAAMTGCVYGMWDDDDGLGFGGGAVRLYGSAPDFGDPIYAFDSELSTPGQQFKQNPLEESAKPPMLDVHEEFAAVRLGPVIEDEGAQEQTEKRFFIGGRAGRVYEFVPTVLPEGKTLLDTAAYPKHILTIPGLASGDDILSFAWWEGVLYILTEDGSDCLVYSYDGETLALELTISSGGNGVLGVWNGEILAACNGSLLYSRDVTGTWSQLTVPSGKMNTPYQITEFEANAYIAAQTNTSRPVILKYDGTTVTAEHEPANITNPWGGGMLATGACVALAVFNGLLDFLYYMEASEEQTKVAAIGTFDDSTWTDVVKTFPGPNDDSENSPEGMVVSKGTLVIMLNVEPGSGDKERSLQAAPGTSIAGTWTTLDSEDPDGASPALAAHARNGGLVAA